MYNEFNHTPSHYVSSGSGHCLYFVSFVPNLVQLCSKPVKGGEKKEVENSPTAPAKTWTDNPWILSPALYHWAIHTPHLTVF